MTYPDQGFLLLLGIGAYPQWTVPLIGALLCAPADRAASVPAPASEQLDSLRQRRSFKSAVLLARETYGGLNQDITVLDPGTFFHYGEPKDD